MKRAGRPGAIANDPRVNSLLTFENLFSVGWVEAVTPALVGGGAKARDEGWRSIVSSRQLIKSARQRDG